MDLPNGILVEFGGWIYRVSKGTTLYPLLSWRAVESWSQPIISIDTLDQEVVVAESRIGFRPGSLLKATSDGKFYFIDGGGKRLVSTPDFWELGFQKSTAIEVSDVELNFHTTLEPIG